MFQHLNKAILIGNVGRDPEKRTMSNGNYVITFSVATNETWTDKNTSERVTKTEWHNIVVYNQNFINFIMKYVKKGTPIYIEGIMRTRSYIDKNGINRTVSEINIQSMEHTLKILDSRPFNGKSEIQSYSNDEGKIEEGNNEENSIDDTKSNNGFEQSYSTDNENIDSDGDDEIPF